VTEEEDMKTGRGTLATLLVFILGAGVLGFTATRTGLIDRLGSAYSTWSLNSRVEALWESRVEGNIEASKGYIVDLPNRSKVGSAVRYFGYEIKNVAIEGDTATVVLDIEYRVAVPGFYSESDPPVRREVVQRWVKLGRTWYWDPGREDDEDDTTEEKSRANAPEGDPSQTPSEE